MGGGEGNLAHPLWGNPLPEGRAWAFPVGEGGTNRLFETDFDGRGREAATDQR